MKVMMVTGALLLVLAVGCGRKAEETPDVRKLTFWHIMNYAGPREILADAARRFEADHPGCLVEIQTFENDDYKTKLAVELASGTPPDILFTWGGGPLAEYAKAGKVMDLTDALRTNDWQGRFIDQALALCQSDGRFYAVPLDLSAVMLWCNRRLFEEAGLEFPRDFDALLKLCPAFRSRGIDACALGNMKQWPGAFYFCYLANRCGGTELFMDAAAGKASFADPAFVRAGELLRQLIEADAFPVGFNGLDDGPARTRFLNGQSAMLLMGSWVVARIKDEKPEFLEQLEPVPFPTVVGGKGAPDAVLGGINCGFAVSSSCAEPELAVEFLRYLTDETVVDAWCGIGRIPALKTTAEQVQKQPLPTQKALAMLQKASSLQPYYDQFLRPRKAVQHKKTTQNLFTGTMTPKQAAAAMDASD